MKGRILALGTLLALRVLLLCSCGRGGVRSEKEIMADMQEKGVMDVMAVSDVPTVEAQGPQVRKSLAPQGLQAEKVRNAGWLHSFDADYHYRGAELHYHVNVSAALSEGGAAW